MDERRSELPVGVTLVTCFQVCKGVFLLLIVYLLNTSPALVMDSTGPLYPFLYIALRGNSSVLDATLQGGSVLQAILSILAVYLVWQGIGLWRRKAWARRSVMFTSGMTLFFYAKSVVLPLLSGVTGMTGGSYPQQNLLGFQIVLFLDLGIFVYMMRSNTADSF